MLVTTLPATVTVACALVPDPPPTATLLYTPLVPSEVLVVIKPTKSAVVNIAPFPAFELPIEDEASAHAVEREPLTTLVTSNDSPP